MEAHEARRLRREWFGKPCDHPMVEREIGQGIPATMCVCPMCGSEFVKREIWEKIRVNCQHQVYQQQEPGPLQKR